MTNQRSTDASSNSFGVSGRRVCVVSRLESAVPRASDRRGGGAMSLLSLPIAAATAAAVVRGPVAAPEAAAGVSSGAAAVAAAAVIGVRHPKWQERPLLFIVRKPGHGLESAEILRFLGERVAKWWVPEEVIFLESLPVGGTGKVQKALLREKYGNVFG